MRIGLLCAAVSLCALVGTPAAWMLATRDFRLKPLLVTGPDIRIYETQ